jgi:pseudouridine kinase
MTIAIASMDIFENMTPEFIKQKLNTISGAALCIIDTNIPKETIEFIVKNIKNVDFFLDTVSSAKAKKIKNLIQYFHTIKPNKIEAEMLSGIKIESNDDLLKVSNFFLEKGVKNVFITLGKDGVFYNNGKEHKLIKSKIIEPINATGAGDAFVAGLAYSHFKNIDIETSTKIAIAASVMAISHEDTINPNINIKNINNLIKELEIC